METIISKLDQEIADFLEEVINRVSSDDTVDLRDLLFSGIKYTKDFTIGIGTREFVENSQEGEEEAGDEDEDYSYGSADEIHEFLIRVEFTGHDFECYIEVQDFSWDGTEVAEYAINFEKDEQEKTSNFEAIAEVALQRLSDYKGKINIILS